MKKAMHWTAYTGQTRFSTLQNIEEIINHHGMILDFKEFSDLSMGLQIEVNPGETDRMHEELTKILDFDEPIETNPGVLVYLNLNFSDGTGNMKNEIPAVPG